MKQTIKLTILSIVNIGLGFIFQWYILAQLGAGMYTDAFFAGMTLPSLVVTVVSGSLMHVLVPLLAGEDKDQLHHDVWAFLILVASLFGIIAIFLYVTASWWIPLVVPGFSDAGKTLSIELARIQLIGMVFSAVNGVQWAAYRAKQQFIWVEFSSIMSGVLVLLLLIKLLPIYGITAAAWLSIFQMCLKTLLLTPGGGKPVWPDFSRPTISIAWGRIKPLLLGNLYFKTDTLIDRLLLSMAGSGVISIYFLGQQIYSAINLVVNRAIVAPLVPTLSRLYKRGDVNKFNQVYYQNLLKALVVSIVGLLVVGFFGENLLRFLIGYGSITINNINTLWWLMIWSGGVLIGGVTGTITTGAFYARGDTTTPVKIGVYVYTIYTPCKIIAFYFFNTKGLAIVTSIYCMANLLLQAYFLRKNHG